MSTFDFHRRQFCRTAAAGFGAMCLPSMGLAEDQSPKADAAGSDEESSVKPLPFVPGSFTVAVLPDTQIYCEQFPQHYYNQTQWLADNVERFNIKYALHLGDITNRNTRDQWAVAQKAMGMLQGKVPYAIVPGNHDYGPNGSCSSRDTYLNEYFPLAEHRKQPTFGEAMEDGKLENTFHTFQAGDHHYLVVALEWGPRDHVVEWADKVVADHPKHRAILITHAYMYYDETRYDWQRFGEVQTWNPHTYPTAKLDSGTNDGEQLWKKLVSKHPNFIMTLNGHVLNDGLGKLTSEGAQQCHVHQMLVNYQMKKEGGEGFMRLVEFLPDNKTVQVKAYSPSLDRFKTDPQNQFVLALDAEV
jgi:hypothetical protein